MRPPFSPLRVLGAPFPVTMESQSGPVCLPSPRLAPPSIRCASLSPPQKTSNNLPTNRSVQQNYWGMTVLCVRTAGENNSSTQRAREPEQGEEKVPWWQPAVCPAWHGEPRSRTSTSRRSFFYYYYFNFTLHISCVYICTK